MFGKWNPNKVYNVLTFYVGNTSSAFGPELAYRLQVAQPTLMDVPIYLIYTIIILLYMFVYHIL